MDSGSSIDVGRLSEVQKEDPADPTGILGYEPADPGYWGSCQLILRDTGVRAS